MGDTDSCFSRRLVWISLSLMKSLTNLSISKKISIPPVAKSVPWFRNFHNVESVSKSSTQRNILVFVSSELRRFLTVLYASVKNLSQQQQLVIPIVLRHWSKFPFSCFDRIAGCSRIPLAVAPLCHVFQFVSISFVPRYRLKWNQSHLFHPIPY